MLFWSHTSSVGGTRNVLRTRNDVSPAQPRLSGLLRAGSKADDEECMSANWTMSFNQAQLLICGRAVGKCTPGRSGGERAIIDELTGGCTTFPDVPG